MLRPIVNKPFIFINRLRDFHNDADIAFLYKLGAAFTIHAFLVFAEHNHQSTKMNRRKFIRNSAMAGAAAIIAPKLSFAAQERFTSQRPMASKRLFSSKAVEKTIKNVKKGIRNPEIAWMFENCYPNTLDTTTFYEVIDGKPDTYIITGDIDAMWLRDSTAQVWPYMDLLNDDEELKLMVQGLVNRQAKCVRLDPYANAFYKDPNQPTHWADDMTDMKPGIHERKWEIDSLCYFIRLSYGYWKKTGDTTPFDAEWLKAAKLVHQTFVEQQRKEGIGPYTFMRSGHRLEDNVPGWGGGNPIKPVGLIVSIFRPSDDSTWLPFLIPSNHFAVVSLRQMDEMISAIFGDYDFGKECAALASEVDNALAKYAEVEFEPFGTVIPYEVDGFGNRLHLDDGNIPSLLSLPYIGAIDADDPLYQNTRKFLFSEHNPYFFKGKYAEGIGGPHVGVDTIWPMSIIMRAMTSSDDDEIKRCLEMLRTTHADTGFMHETFHKDDPKKFSRSWFAWCNTLFGELIVKIHHEKPHILKEI